MLISQMLNTKATLIVTIDSKNMYINTLNHMKQPPFSFQK